MSATLGQVGLIPGASNWVQYLICKVTRSHCAHTILDIGDGQCIGAEPGGARIRPLGDFPTAIWTQFELTPEQAQASADWGRAREHTPYNWADDALIGLECWLGFKLPKLITRTFQNEATLECAQLCDGALTEGAGIEVFSDHRSPGEVFPGSFEFLSIEKGWHTAEYFNALHVSYRAQVTTG